MWEMGFLAHIRFQRTGEIHTVENAVILVVEDESIIRMDAVQTLEDAGFLALEAGDADEAIRILEGRSDIRAVFTDIQMPGSLCGLRLAKAVRERWPPIHLIVTSARIGLTELDLPSLAGFLAKPYTPNQVITVLTELFATDPSAVDKSQTRERV